MVKLHTSRALVAATIGAVAGSAFVIRSDWITLVIGAVLGCVLTLCAYGVLEFCLRLQLRTRSALGQRTWNMKPWDDYDQHAYRVERIFLDDGKPW